VKVTSLRDYWFGPLRAGLFFLLLGAGILLLIACVDVANLTMTRAVERQHAVAVRTAMGASRTRLVRQLFTESLLLAVFGSALGLLLAGWSTRLLVAISGVDFQSFIDFRAGLPVVGVVMVLALLLGIVFGVVPLWVTLRGDAVQTLHRQGKNPVKGFGRHGFQSSVVIAQVALALTLAVGAGLIAKGYRHLVSQDLGYQPDELLTMRIDLKGDQWSDDHDVIRLVERLLDRLEPLPGVGSVAIAGPTIPTDDWAGGYVTLEDYVSDSPDGTVPVMMHAVTPEYFETLGATIVRGDVFTMQDRESSRVVIAKALADRYWPDQDPIGKQLKFGARNNMERPWLTVMGVADDIDQAGPLGLERPAPDIYVPALQFQVRLPLRLNFLVRPEPGLSAASLGERVRAEIQEEAPDLAVYDVRTMEQRLATQTEHGRFEVLLVSLFTFIALVLAIIGVYGVISYGVAQRTREIGIRMALGADRRDVLRLVVLRGTALAAMGLGIGLVAVLLLRGWLEELMYGTSAMDPVILIGTSVLLLAVTAVASFVPARRASRLEPVRGLRSE
jgi:putative ABC transport system permease protein